MYSTQLLECDRDVHVAAKYIPDDAWFSLYWKAYGVRDHG